MRAGREAVAGGGDPDAPSRTRTRLSAIAVLALLAWIAWILAAVIRHDDERDRFGRLPVPGAAELALERGDAAVSYFERGVSIGEDHLALPADLRVEIRPPGGAPALVPREVGGADEEFENIDGSGRRWALVAVPADGRYRVTAAGATGRRNPEVMLGPATAFLTTAAGIGLLAGVAVIVLACLAWAAVVVRGAT